MPSFQTLSDIEAHEARSPLPIGDLQNTYDLLRARLSAAACAPALTFLRSPADEAPRVWTGAEFLDAITKCANMLRGLGIGRDAVAAIALPNLPETHCAIWGAEAAGVALVLNPMLSTDAIQALIDTTRARVVITLGPAAGRDVWERVSAAAARCPHVQALLVVAAPDATDGDDAESGGAEALRAYAAAHPHIALHRFQALLDRQDAVPRFEPPGLDDVCSLFCTGGTTGAPKIARRTHRTEVGNSLQVAAVLGPDLIGHGSTVFVGLPLFHVNAQLGTGLSVWAAGGHVLLGTADGYRTPGLLQGFWQLAARHAVTVFSGVPTIFAALLQVPRGDADLSALRAGVCGAASMPQELFARFTAATGVQILEGYGLTEGGCVSSLTPPGAPARVGSIGLRLPWQPMRVVVLDAQGRYQRDAQVDEVGTIAIAGPNLFAGYHNPAHERGAWLDRPEPGGGVRRWLNTGDLGRCDPEGYFWLVGRSKELIIRGGHNIDPRGIEAALCAHPAVSLAAAVGRPDAHAGEVPVAYVQLRPGAGVDATGLMQWAAQRIGDPAALPKRVQVLDALPLTAVGKIFKPELVRREWCDVLAQEAAAAGLTLEALDVSRDEGGRWQVAWSGTGDAQAFEKRLTLYGAADVRA